MVEENSIRTSGSGRRMQANSRAGDDLVNEELLAREAQAMGLGENDTIIRRRLAQKLKFLVEDTSRLAEPTDSELRQYFEANAARFENSPRRVVLPYLFQSRKSQGCRRRCRGCACRAERRRRRRSCELGDRFLLEAEMTRCRPTDHCQHVRRRLRRRASDGRARQMERAAEIRLRTAPRLFVSARKAARNRFRNGARQGASRNGGAKASRRSSQDYLARLREKYGVEFDDSVKALLEPQPAADVAMQ